jgi:hypothetical protein
MPTVFSAQQKSTLASPNKKTMNSGTITEPEPTAPNIRRPNEEILSHQTLAAQMRKSYLQYEAKLLRSKNRDPQRYLRNENQ